MKGLFLQRGRGKTTASIYTSAMTGCPIIVANKTAKRYIKELAAKYGVVIPEPISVRECARGRHLPNGVLIDNAEEVIRTWVQENLNTHVVAFTMTVDNGKREDCET